MFTLHLTRTEIEIIERALALAAQSGCFPDPAIAGDEVRINALRADLRRGREALVAETWGGRKR